mmetsp:Transcript_53062/g.152982  ORF Transcript_53062/g.152982 Transcript_53062/m.152982 type:complete len:391 (-) Transcript_53062:123-1295(-)
MSSPEVDNPNSEALTAFGVAFNPMAAEFVPGQTWGKSSLCDLNGALADFGGGCLSTPPGLGDVSDSGSEVAAAADTPVAIESFLRGGQLFEGGELPWCKPGEVHPSDEPAKVKVRGKCVASDTSVGSQWSTSTDSLLSGGLELTAPPAGTSHLAEEDLTDIDCAASLARQVSAPGVPVCPGGFRETTCRWHKSANTVGIVSEDGHVFTKTTSGRQKVCMGSRGRPIELAPLCMVFDESLRCGGTHCFNYQILEGELGAADGAGFVFDSKVRRNNIQRMRSVFLNQRGCVCIRDHERVKKLGVRLPPLGAGMSLGLQIDLDSLYMQFIVFSVDGRAIGSAEVSVGGFFGAGVGIPRSCGMEVGRSMDGNEWQPGSGFFCAVVTKEVSVGLV